MSKRPGRPGSLAASAATVLIAAGLAAAHGGGVIAQGSPARIHQELIEIFGKDAAFSATAVLTSKKESGDLVERVGYRLRHGVLRLDRNSNDNPFMTEAQKKSRRERGVDEWYSVVRADSSILVFPKRKAYVVLPDSDEPPGRIEHAALGEATLDGRACSKERVVVDNGEGDTAIIVWRPAGEPTGIPLRIENDHGDSTMVLEFENVNREAPDAALFEPPAEFKKYPTMKELSEALR